MKTKECEECCGTGTEFNGNEFITCTLCKGNKILPDVIEEDEEFQDDYSETEDITVPFDENQHGINFDTDD